MQPEWISYVERLLTIKRTSTQDMTQFEILHLSGLLLTSEHERQHETVQNMDDDTIWHHQILLPPILRTIEKWLITGEDDDAKLLLQSIKSSVISLYSPTIDFILKSNIDKERENSCDQS